MTVALWLYYSSELDTSRLRLLRLLWSHFAIHLLTGNLRRKVCPERGDWVSRRAWFSWLSYFSTVQNWPRSLFLLDLITSFWSVCCSDSADEEHANIDWNNLGFGLTPTDYMYVTKSTGDGRFEQGKLDRFGSLELSPAAGVLNYGQVCKNVWILVSIEWCILFQLTVKSHIHVLNIIICSTCTNMKTQNRDCTKVWKHSGGKMEESFYSDQIKMQWECRLELKDCACLLLQLTNLWMLWNKPFWLISVG